MSTPLVPLKYACVLNPESLLETTDPDYEIEYVDIGSVTLEKGIESRESLRFVQSPSRARKPIQNGDTLVATVRTYLKAIALVEEASSNWIASTGFAVCRPRPDVEPRYLYRVIQSSPFVESVVACSTGVSYPAINPSTLGNLCIPLPDLPAQKAIADFLDRETARIDQLIAKKERMVEKIDQRATSLTWTLVTGQDASCVPSTDSGFDWIGNIPTHWQAVRIKTVAQLESGHTPSRSNDDYWNNPTIPWVSLADSAQLRRTEVITETKHMISEAGLAGSSARILPAGTVAFTRDATVGLAAILGRDMAVSQHLVGWVCGQKLDPWYLLYVIYAMQHELNRLTWGATIKTIGMPDLRKLSCPLPPLDEQQQIVLKLEAALGSTKRLTGKLTNSIDHLRELRSALITAAVTGQIDVTTWGRRGETDRRLDSIQHDLEAERVEVAE